MANEIKKEYRFRKMYFVCEDLKVIADNVEMTNAYRKEETALSVAKTRAERTSHLMWEDKEKPLPKVTVEAFYLVPEKLYKEILEKHVADRKGQGG